MNYLKGRNFGGKKIWRIWRNLIWRMTKFEKYGRNLIWRMPKITKFGGNLIWRMRKNSIILK